MTVVLYDFEVFMYDTLLGIDVFENGEFKRHQTWNLEEMREIYKQHADDIWVAGTITTTMPQFLRRL